MVKGGFSDRVAQFLQESEPAEIEQLIDAQNKYGNTALYSAILVEEGHERKKIVETLLKYNARCDIATIFGHTPLHRAAFHGEKDLVKLILNNATGKATINVQDKKGNTPLHEAVMFINFGDSREKILVRLLKAGANPYIKNNNQKSPWDYVVDYEVYNGRSNDDYSRAVHVLSKYMRSYRE